MVKVKVCEVCGRQYQARRQPYCVECGLDRMIDAAEQMHRRKGPIYERWKHGMLAHTSSLKNKEG